MSLKLDYFKQTIDPAPFGRGFGALSILIRIINFWRICTSHWLCLLILRAQLRQTSFSKQEKARIYKEAKSRLELSLDDILPSRTRKANTLLEETSAPAPPKTREERVRLRYSAARLNSDDKLRGPKPLEANELSSIFDQVFIAQDRSARYLRRRGGENALLVDVEPYLNE